MIRTGQSHFSHLIICSLKQFIPDNRNILEAIAKEYLRESLMKFVQEKTRSFNPK
jgi:intein-encoded DNA endonuclease-like protein